MNAKCATLFPASGKWFTRTLVDRFVTVNQTIRRAGFQTILLPATKWSGPQCENHNNFSLDKSPQRSDIKNIRSLRVGPPDDPGRRQNLGAFSFSPPSP
jgi:hypothetical protein